MTGKLVTCPLPIAKFSFQPKTRHHLVSCIRNLFWGNFGELYCRLVTLTTEGIKSANQHQLFSFLYIILIFSIVLFLCTLHCTILKKAGEAESGGRRQVRETGGGMEECESWMQRNIVKSSSWVTWVMWLHKILSYSWSGMFSHAYMIPHKLPHLP